LSDAADPGNDDFDDDDEFDDDEDDYNRADGNTVAVPTARAVLDYVVRQIVDEPDAVQIEVDDSGRRPSLNVHVAPGDMGRVIGKRGRVAQSIRTVVRAAAARDGREIEVEFVD
jgi:predicted RNA-binding protein YlqC (UPF0109 family)